MRKKIKVVTFTNISPIYMYMSTKMSLPNLREFVFDCIVSKGKNFLFDTLDREDFLKVKTESKIRKFAEHANMEDVDLLMSKLGMGCARFYWDRDKEFNKKVHEVVLAYLEYDQKDLTQVIIKEKTFACLDIDFIKALQTISKISTSKTYTVNRKYLKIRDSAEKFTRTLVNKLQAEKNLEWYCQTIDHAYDIEPSLESFGLDLLKFRVLIYLNTLQNGATKDNISRKLSRVNVTGMLNEMYDKNLVELSGENKSVVTIGVNGVMTLDRLLSKFP